KIREYGFSMFTKSSTDTSGGSSTSEKFSPNLSLKLGKSRTQQVLNDILKTLKINSIINLPENFSASIQALESASIVKVHSTPQIATINGNPASITIGETRYYKLKKETQAAVNNGSSVIGTDERFEVLKFNNELQVTPWIMDKGYVMVKIRPEFNIPSSSSDASTPPNVNTKLIESMVRLHDGQTIVLGGQRQTETTKTSSSIPFFGSIPIIGWFFSSRSINKTETQMMIFLTPHVYYGDDNAVKPDEYFGKEVNDIIGNDKKDKKKKE
ncbi:MAG TPA: hypothetical protein DCO75_12935, partial [Fibrobacteres bacterium]|nr:hypothetical protein [Fibrobacterota bacterium]